MPRRRTAEAAEAATPDPGPDREATPEEQARQDALMREFDPATEAVPDPVLPPGWTHELLLRDDVTGPLEEERDKLREQVRLLQHELERVDEKDLTYEHDAAGTGHLVERLARVTAAMSRIPKRGYNQSQNYAFVAHSDVLDAVRPALAAEGVSFASTIVECEATPEGRKTDKGAQWCMWRVKVEMTFHCYWYPFEGAHGAPGSEEQQSSWLGFAQDYSDKGASKALTSAIKTFLIQQFLVSTGDDPDEPTADQSSTAETTPRNRQSVDSDVRHARNAALDFNQKLPQGVLSKIARKVAGQGVVIKIEDAAQLQKIAKAAERYVANPEGGEAWLRGDAAEQPNGDDVKRQESSGEPEPAPLPPADSYDPPLNEDEARQHGLGLNPRPEEGAL